jgi:hypothetical protein
MDGVEDLDEHLDLRPREPDAELLDALAERCSAV